MLGTILGIVAASYVCKKCYENHQLKDEVRDLRQRNRYLTITFDNHRKMLRNYDNVNKFAKRHGFHGAADFFEKLYQNYDRRFYPLFKFIENVTVVRNSFAHRGVYYRIDQTFLDKLKLCYKVCNEFEKLPHRTQLMIGN